MLNPSQSYEPYANAFTTRTSTQAHWHFLPSTLSQIMEKSGPPWPFSTALLSASGSWWARSNLSPAFISAVVASEWRSTCLTGTQASAELRNASTGAPAANAHKNPNQTINGQDFNSELFIGKKRIPYPCRCCVCAPLSSHTLRWIYATRDTCRVKVCGADRLCRSLKECYSGILWRAEAPIPRKICSNSNDSINLWKTMTILWCFRNLAGFPPFKTLGE